MLLSDLRSFRNLGDAEDGGNVIIAAECSKGLGSEEFQQRQVFVISTIIWFTLKAMAWKLERRDSLWLAG